MLSVDTYTKATQPMRVRMESVGQALHALNFSESCTSASHVAFHHGNLTVSVRDEGFKVRAEISKFDRKTTSAKSKLIRGSLSFVKDRLDAWIKTLQ